MSKNISNNDEHENNNAFTLFELRVKASQIRFNYNLRQAINDLNGFVESNKRFEVENI